MFFIGLQLLAIYASTNVFFTLVQSKYKQILILAFSNDKKWTFNLVQFEKHEAYSFRSALIRVEAKVKGLIRHVDVICNVYY